MTSRLASRPAPPPRPLRRGRGSFRVTSRRRAVCARRSHLSPPCAASLSEVTLRGGARVGATPPLASPDPAILAGPVGPNSTGSLPPSPVGDVVESDDELIKSPSVRFAGRSCRTCGPAFALGASARPTRSIAKRAEWRARFAQARPAIIIRLSGKTSEQTTAVATGRRCDDDERIVGHADILRRSRVDGPATLTFCRCTFPIPFVSRRIWPLVEQPSESEEDLWRR